MKKVAILSLALLLLSTLPMAAFAQDTAGYAQCTVANCNITEDHAHGNSMFTGHTMDDGHDYHQLCAVRNCKETGNHDHDGVTHLPHNGSDGHSYHSNTEHNGSKSNNGGKSSHKSSGSGKSGHKGGGGHH